MRKKRTRSEWKNLLEEFNNSNKTVAEFSSEQGIHPNTFYAMRTRIKNSKPDTGNELVEIKMPVQKNHCYETKIQIGRIEIYPGENIKTDYLTQIIHVALEASNAAL